MIVDAYGRTRGIWSTWHFAGEDMHYIGTDTLKSGVYTLVACEYGFAGRFVNL